MNAVNLITFDAPWQSRQCVNIGMVLGSPLFNVILIGGQLNSPTLQAGHGQHRNTTFGTKKQGEMTVVREQRTGTDGIS